MPLAYATYTGNGSNATFSVPFPYLLKAHVKLYIGYNILDGSYTSLLVDGTNYTWSSATQVQLTTAPAAGQVLTIIRDTPDSSQLVPWQDGSNLIAGDLNTADLQNLYVVQEQQDRNDAGITQSTAAQTAANAATTAANTATSTANTALSTSNTALTNANAAVSTANTASSNASAAVSTANTAASNASAAVSTANAASSTANTASTNASNAVTTANAASATAATALSTANTAATNASAAVSTANTASSNASAAVTTANTASTNASNAVTTANTANTNASAAVTTANTASTNASTAVTTANSANNKADQAIAAVSNSINYQLKANVAAIPASPANDTYIEVQDSTGLESFTPLAGKPAGFVGDAGLSVRLRYTSTGTTWNWLNYYANNSDSRYLKLTGGSVTGNVAVSGTLTKGGSNVVTVGDTGTVTSAMIADGTIVNGDISGTAAIDKTKISGTAITAADTGTVTSTMIADGTILNADINASAAIAGTKISPDFGSQNTTTTGTSTAASFIPTGSTAPTNGVYLPSANNVAISTNGTGRLFVDASGRVIVGASSAAVGNPLEVVATSNGNAIAVRGRSSDNQGIITFHPNASSTEYARIQVESDSSLRFGTGSSGTERMRLDSSGRLGLGTSSPGLKLDVAATGDDGIRFSTTGTSNSARLELSSGSGTTSGKYAYIKVQNNDTNAQGYAFGTFGDDRWVIRDTKANIERFCIDASGRLGLGTSSPQDVLHLSKAGDLYLRVSNTSTGVNAYLGQDSSGTYLGNSGASDVRFIQGATERMRLTSTGLGIGVTSNRDSTKLDVLGDITFGANASYYGTIGYNAATGHLEFTSSDGLFKWIRRSGLATSMVLDNSGRLLVGTSSSVGYGGLLQVVGGDTARPQIHRNLNDQYPPIIYFSKARGTGSQSVSSGDSIGQIGFVGYDGTGQVSAATIECLVDGTPGTNSMPGRIVLSTTASGTSSPTERFRINSAGSFSAVIPSGSTLYPAFWCRAWATFNGTGTVSLVTQGNVSSITDNGNGDYTINFTSALPDGNYAVSGTAKYPTNTNAHFIGLGDVNGANAPSTTACRFRTIYSPGPSAQDCEIVTIAVFR